MQKTTTYLLPKGKKNSKNLLVEQYYYIVPYVARKILRRIPKSISLDELISAGNLGLIDAAKKFNKDKNVSFQTYAKYRINGAILDELRGVDWYSRTIRKKVQNIEKAITKVEKRESRSATSEEIAKELNIDIEDYFKDLKQINGATVLSLDHLIHNNQNSSDKSLSFKDQVKDENYVSPEEEYRNKELKNILVKTIKTLSEKEQLVVSLYYFDELTLKEIGKTLDLTESRVCQLHTALILKLKTRIESFCK